MLGAPDPLYVAAREALLDALQAVGAHRDALVLVGAQAVYVHAGEAGLAIAPFTTDADLAIDPNRLGPDPLLENALTAACFEGKAVGIWMRTIEMNEGPRPVSVDFLVPDSLGGEGRRGARIPPHGQDVARKVVGLEATLVDNERQEIVALGSGDERRFELSVAGPAALLVAKVHKIMDRADETRRLKDKDALDVYRLLQAVPTEKLAEQLKKLGENEISVAVTQAALAELPRLFGRLDAPGCQMAVRATEALLPGSTMAASIVALTNDLLAERY